MTYKLFSLLPKTANAEWNNTLRQNNNYLQLLCRKKNRIVTTNFYYARDILQAKLVSGTRGEIKF